MLKLIRFIGLLSQSIFLQFVHFFGVVAFGAAVAVGYFRLPSWLVAVLAVIFGIVADKFIDQGEVAGILEKAAAANQRGGFLIVVYFVIVGVGYIVGAYGRHHLGRNSSPAPAATPATSKAKRK